MYRPGVSLAATRVEQFMYTPGVGTFYATQRSVFCDPTTSPLLYQRVGLPIPRTIYCC